MCAIKSGKDINPYSTEYYELIRGIVLALPESEQMSGQ
jgi:hypothetical protein